ncbi:Nuclear factor 1 [Bienertia sinuspersici]
MNLQVVATQVWKIIMRLRVITVDSICYNMHLEYLVCILRGIIRMTMGVCKLYEHVTIDEDMYNLVCCPSRVVRRCAGYIVNEYYGVLKDIFKVLYLGGNCAFVFKCAWFNVQHHGRGYKVNNHGLISVNNRFCLKIDELYALESQVKQTLPRDLYNMLNKDVDQGIDEDVYQQVDAIET